MCMGIWWQMLCVSGSGKTHERLKRRYRKEQRSTLKSECSTANTVAVTRRCFNLMMNSQFVLLQLWKGKTTPGHGNGDVGNQVIWSNLLPTFLCWRTLSRTGKAVQDVNTASNSNTVTLFIRAFSYGYLEHWTGRWCPTASFLVTLCQRCCIWVQAILATCYLRRLQLRY